MTVCERKAQFIEILDDFESDASYVGAGLGDAPDRTRLIAFVDGLLGELSEPRIGAEHAVHGEMS